MGASVIYEGEGGCAEGSRPPLSGNYFDSFGASMPVVSLRGDWHESLTDCIQLLGRGRTAIDHSIERRG
jgi:hypothetical protein